MDLPALQIVPGAKDPLDTTMRSASERTTTMNQHDEWRQYMATDIAPGPQLPPRHKKREFIVEVFVFTAIGTIGMMLVILAAFLYFA